MGGKKQSGSFINHSLIVSTPNHSWAFTHWTRSMIYGKHLTTFRIAWTFVFTTSFLMFTLTTSIFRLIAQSFSNIFRATQSYFRNLYEKRSSDTRLIRKNLFWHEMRSCWTEKFNALLVFRYLHFTHNKKRRTPTNSYKSERKSFSWANFILIGGKKV